MSLTNEERQILVQRELDKAHEAYENYTRGTLILRSTQNKSLSQIIFP